jgi:hypothetical protein
MKSQDVTRYDIPSKHYGGWGVFFVGSDGLLSIVSDYGNFGYWWDCPGCEFRKFLCQIDDGYLYRKLTMGKSDGLDVEQTARNLRRLVGSLIRDGSWTMEQAREELEHIAHFQCDEDCTAYYYNTKLDDIHEETVTKPHQQTMALIERLWPRFIDVLKAELETEDSCGQ